MSTTQGQDTGKAPENQGSGGAAPVDDFGDAFAQLVAPEAAPAGVKAAAEPVGGDAAATGSQVAPAAEDASAGKEGGLPDPKDVNGDGTAKGAAVEPQAAPAKEAASAPATLDPSKQFLDELKGILTPPPAPQQEEQRPPAVTPLTAEPWRSRLPARR